MILLVFSDLYNAARAESVSTEVNKVLRVGKRGNSACRLDLNALADVLCKESNVLSGSTAG